MHLEEHTSDDILRPSENKFDRIVKRTEEVIFAVIIISMIAIGLAPIVLRYAGMPGLSWTESLSQHMLLWITFLGAGVAIRERSSISIDAVPHLLNPHKRIIFRAVTEIFSAMVCGILVYFSILFVQDTFEYEGESIAFLNFKEWWLTLTLPCGFALLTLRLIIATIEDLMKAVRMSIEKRAIIKDHSSEEAK